MLENVFNSVLLPTENEVDLTSVSERKPCFLPACVHLERFVDIGTTTCSVCITVTSSTIVGAAVIGEKLSNLEGKVVFGAIKMWLESPGFFEILLGDKFQRCSVAVLPVPVHGVAAHAQPWAHTAPQGHCNSWKRELVSRLEHYKSKTCRR